MIFCFIFMCFYEVFKYLYKVNNSILYVYVIGYKWYIYKKVVLCFDYLIMYEC